MQNMMINPGKRIHLYILYGTFSISIRGSGITSQPGQVNCVDYALLIFESGDSSKGAFDSVSVCVCASVQFFCKSI